MEQLSTLAVLPSVPNGSWLKATVAAILAVPASFWRTPGVNRYWQIAVPITNV